MESIPPEFAKKVLNRDFANLVKASAGGRKDQPHGARDVADDDFEQESLLLQGGFPFVEFRATPVHPAGCAAPLPGMHSA